MHAEEFKQDHESHNTFSAEKKCKEENKSKVQTWIIIPRYITRHIHDATGSTCKIYYREVLHSAMWVQALYLILFSSSFTSFAPCNLQDGRNLDLHCMSYFVLPRSDQQGRSKHNPCSHKTICRGVKLQQHAKQKRRLPVGRVYGHSRTTPSVINTKISQWFVATDSAARSLHGRTLSVSWMISKNVSIKNEILSLLKLYSYGRSFYNLSEIFTPFKQITI